MDFLSIEWLVAFFAIAGKIKFGGMIEFDYNGLRHFRVSVYLLCH
jgi:hypothetical protein